MGLNVAILPVVTKDNSHLSPVHALRFIIAMQVQHSYNSSANGRILLTHVLTFSATDARIKILLDKSRTHDFRTSRCASYLLDHSGNEGMVQIQ